NKPFEPGDPVTGPQTRTAAATTSVLSTRAGKLLLGLLCSVAFLDFVDVTIVNVALPSIRDDLGFTVQQLQWVPSGYLLTYGGFMLLGGRAADLLGRRRVLLAGIVLFGAASLVGGFADSAIMLVGSRLVQGLGAALTLPAALSILTTTYAEGPDRQTALGVWGGVGGLASAVGVLLGGALTEGPGWRWVMFINPVVVLLLVPAVLRLVPDDRKRETRGSFDVLGSVLGTAGLLVLVYALVEAPDDGWGSASTIGGLAAAVALLGVFVLNERRVRAPLMPLSIFRVRGLAAADLTQLLAFAGFLAMFFFVTLYLQTVLGYSPIETGLAYLPVCVGAGLGAGVGSQLIARTGTRPLTVGGALVGAVGIALLSRVPVQGSYVVDLLPGLVIMSVGLGAVFVSVASAANAGVPADRAGLAAALLNTAQQLGGALGLAVLSALATARTDNLLASGAAPPVALTSGFERGLLAGAAFLVAAAVIGARTANTTEVSA
ncbi:MAG: MFS transporter, partial [Nocardioides sp.]